MIDLQPKLRISPVQLQTEQLQRGQLRQGARVVEPNRQGGPGHAHPDTAARASVHRHTVPTGTGNVLGARIPGHFRCGRLVPGPVRGAVVLLLQRRGNDDDDNLLALFRVVSFRRKDVFRQNKSEISIEMFSVSSATRRRVVGNDNFPLRI